MNTFSRLRKCLAVGIILLFVGVAIAPSINVVVAKDTAHHKFIEGLVDSNRFSKQTLVTLPQQEIQELKALFDSFDEKLLNPEKRDGPWMWLFFRILEILSGILKTVDYVINLIKEGRFLSEMFRGVCIILLVIFLIPAVLRTFIQDFLPRDFEDTLLYYILGWLGSIVWPDNQVAVNTVHRIVKNIISFEISEE